MTRVPIQWLNAAYYQASCQAWQQTGLSTPQELHVWPFEGVAILPSPEELRGMEDEFRLLLVERLFHEVDRFQQKVAARMKAIHMDDEIRELDKIVDWTDEHGTWLRSLETLLFSNFIGNDRALAGHYSSSYGQSIYSLRSGSVAYRDARAMQRSNKRVQAVQRELENPALHTRDIYGGRTLSYTHSRKELADTVDIALTTGAQEIRWQGDVLQMRHPLSGLPVRSDLPHPFQLLAWPPDPQDRLLLSLQRVLDWEIGFATDADGVNVRINFADALLASS